MVKHTAIVITAVTNATPMKSPRRISFHSVPFFQACINPPLLLAIAMVRMGYFLERRSAIHITAAKKIKANIPKNKNTNGP
jgi:hypothetical protein